MGMGGGVSVGGVEETDGQHLLRLICFHQGYLLQLLMSLNACLHFLSCFLLSEMSEHQALSFFLYLFSGSILLTSSYSGSKRVSQCVETVKNGAGPASLPISSKAGEGDAGIVVICFGIQAPHSSEKCVFGWAFSALERK